MHYNRRQRRELAREMGMIAKNEQFSTWRERIQRSQEAGRQIDRQFQNENETNLRNAAADNEARILANLTESVGEERAKAIMTSNRKISDTREEKLVKRRIKQKENLANKAI